MKWFLVPNPPQISYEEVKMKGTGKKKRIGKNGHDTVAFMEKSTGEGI